MVFPHLAVPFRSVLAALCLLLLVTACSDGSNDTPPSSAQPFAELFSQGIGRYLGLYTPMLSEQQGDHVQHTFGIGDGPLCGNGSNYTLATRDQESQDLHIFIEGGGVCWSDVCLYIDFAATGISDLGIMDTQRDDNPVGSWNQVYIPSCDGSLMSGDIDVDVDGDGIVDRYQRGLHNISAALDVSVKTFPAPRRILLSGQSAGGLATIFVLPLVRKAYPGVRIDVLNDSGVGVALPNDPDFMLGLIDDWNMRAFLPASCPECVPAEGHFTNYMSWQLDQDLDVKRAFVSYSRDINLADLFLMIGGDAFQEALLGEMQRAEDAHPERVRSWLVDGAGHTFVTLEPDRTAGGVPLLDWIGFMIDDSADWVSVRDPALE